MRPRKSLMAIPTHIFMGFLGSGKTSAILNLFEKKPTNERWAVLVNEYGKLGIDGAHYQSQGIYVKEIPGGCMCCAAGVPMQVAINRLLKQSRPDRLFVETSGLGHPDGVLKTLNGPHFQTVLLLKASFCLLDPEKLLSPAMYVTGLLEQQIALADILVANKIDLASGKAMEAFDNLGGRCLLPKLVVAKTTFGVLDSSWLELNPVPSRGNDTVFLGANTSTEKSEVFVFSQAFPEGCVFSHQKLEVLFKRMSSVRIKSICKTDKGWLLFNGEGQRLTASTISNQNQSRFDIILETQCSKAQLEQGLNHCLLS